METISFLEMINKMFNEEVTEQLEEHKKETERQKKEAKEASKQLAEISKTFKDEILKKGFSKEFTETLLLEIIKNIIRKEDL